MTFSTQTAGSGSASILNTGTQPVKKRMNFSAMVANWFGRTMVKFGAGIQALQAARMMSTLSNMSDYQLTQVGITRSDIPQYAQKLMAKD